MTTKKVCAAALMLMMALTQSVSAGNIIKLDSWMAGLNDDLKVCKVSIPGTHDTMTGEGFTDTKYVDGFTTQVASLDDQLNGGIRFIDIRLTLMGSDENTVVQTSHSVATTKVSFDGVLEKLTNFLSLHKSEFVIMKIQHDGRSMNDEQKKIWARLMQKSLADNASLFVGYRPDLRVKDVRGKVIFISRDDYGDKSYGAYTNWPDEGDGVTPVNLKEERSLVMSTDKVSLSTFKGADKPNATRLYVQDFYNTTGKGIDIKLKALEDMYESAIAVPEKDNVWVINHCSAFGLTECSADGYAYNACKTNAKMLSLLKNDKRRGSIGIIAIDYACTDQAPVKIGSLTLTNRKVMGKSLIKAIIERNF